MKKVAPWYALAKVLERLTYPWDHSNPLGGMRTCQESQSYALWRSQHQATPFYHESHGSAWGFLSGHWQESFPTFQYAHICKPEWAWSISCDGDKKVQYFFSGSLGNKSEYVIDRQTMVLAGSLSQLKWRNLLKASRWSKRRQKLVTQSYSHSNRLMATRSNYVYTSGSIGNSYSEYPPPHWLKYRKILWGISVYIWET